MKAASKNKRKIFNDPVYGFIKIPDDLIFDLIEHKWFQRLRRIKQLGLTHLVYPGALHTRFSHTLGAMHLMEKAIAVLRAKGQEISSEEAQAVNIAILLHDMGHGPFSHTLEKTIIPNLNHEDLSLLFMQQLNREFSGKLDLALQIFKNEYHKKYLHQMVTSQLDMDRLDYLKRDSFFTGVSEGVTGTDRIIAMLNVADEQLVAEAKGIYSIEKFIIARRLMYWQVYLHKTVIAAEYQLTNILKRARELTQSGDRLFAPPSLLQFLQRSVSHEDFAADNHLLDQFASLDDYDVMTAVKVWSNHKDKVLALLCRNLIERRLPKIELTNTPVEQDSFDAVFSSVKSALNLEDDETKYFVFKNATENHAYDVEHDKILLLYKDGKTRDITVASDQLNISVLSKPVTKYFLCYPKDINLINS